MNNNKDIKNSLENLIEQTYLIEKEYKALNESYISLQSFIKSIVEALPTALWVINQDGSVFLQNSEAESLGFLLELINLKEPRQEINLKASYFQVIIKQKDDKTIISANDITNEKRSERLASMGQVSAHLAHEIRNPIGSIALLSSTLLKRIDDKNKPILEEMQKAIWRVERIIKATLLFTKGVVPNKYKFDLISLKNECEDVVKLYTYSKDISFEFKFESCPYVGDKDLLSMVFQNLIFNAIDAIESDDNDSGKVEINFYKTNTTYEFEVYDSGIAIEDDNILFEPFKTTKLKGNGLGLSLCKQIIKAHDGEICIKNSPKRFCVSLKI